MSGGLSTWSQTAATNATADPTVNWAEGQAPSTVNDSARSLMASAAKWRDDIAGLIATGGTSTAYTLTSYQVFASLSAMGGQTVAFIATVANGAAATLNVDGLGAKALTIDGTTALPTGSFNALGLYSATYNSTLSVWIVHNLYSGNTIFPSGTSMLFMQTAAPTGWVKQSTHNDKALRITTGTASSGGATAFTSVFNAAGGSTILTAANLPVYNLDFSGFTANLANGTVSGALTVSGATGNTGANPGVPSTASGGGVGDTITVNGSLSVGTTITIGGTGVPLGGSGTGHTHTTPNIAYVDAIICNKS